MILVNVITEEAEFDALMKTPIKKPPQASYFGFVRLLSRT
jgi:hypothetical protein